MLAEWELNQAIKAPREDVPALERQRDARLEAALGPVLFRHYQRVQDSVFAGVEEWGHERGLPQKFIEWVYDWEECVTKQERVLINQGIPEEQRLETLHSALRAAEAGFREHLGDEHIASYSDSMHGLWLEGFESESAQAAAETEDPLDE